MRNNLLIITAAICGAEVTKEQNPYVPYTTDEIAEEARRSVEAGAAIIHLHVRKDDGTPTQDMALFKEAIEKIKERAKEAIIQVSTGGAVGMSVEERVQPLALHPEMCTLTTGTVNFGNDVFMNSMPMIEAIANKINEYGVKPEIEIFDAGFVDNAAALLKKGLIREPLHFDFVLGVPGGMTGTEDRLRFLISIIPRGATWSVAGIGRFEFPLAELAISLGGHVRVGLEDNIFISKGVLAKGNAELVSKVVTLAKSAGREIATPDEAREILKLKQA